MANVPLVSNPILPPVPDEPRQDSFSDQDLQDTFDKIWKWMKDVSIQLKILFGSPQASNSQITIPLVQAGTVLPFAGVVANIPTGYLACDGAVVSQTQYAALFAAIGTQWNTGGEGSGNFRLPDLRSRGLIGAGPGSGGLSARSVGQKGGEETHTLTVAELPHLTYTLADPGHNHTLTDPGHSHTVIYEANAGGNFGGAHFAVAEANVPLQTGSSSTGISIHSATTGISVSDSNGGGAHNNMEPFGVVQWMIKF